MSQDGWRKSSRSDGSANSDCVEIRSSDGAFQVRDSKLGDDSPVFSMNTVDLVALIQNAKR